MLSIFPKKSSLPSWLQVLTALVPHNRCQWDNDLLYLKVKIATIIYVSELVISLGAQVIFYGVSHFSILQFKSLAPNHQVAGM